ncbi:MAG: DUF362 domain-containing protein [Bacteroidales bacterium]|nr:DUF362 domain-containing protein [Bacteroidales bacterium]
MQKKSTLLLIFQKIRKLLSFKNISARTSFIFIGIASTIWFLIRVIPKPQRAGYPCMRAAAPIMSGFVIYILTLSGGVLFFKKAFSRFRQARYLSGGLALLLCLVLLVVFNLNDVQKLYANTFGFTRGVLPDSPNTPMGEGHGVFPGRVVWAWNPAATNENCTDVITNAFFMAKNNNQDTINAMADISIKKLGGQASVKDSWDAIFKSFNNRKTGSASPYVTGQKIFIKVNNGQAGWAINTSDLSETGNNSSTGVKNAAMAGTTPATVLAIVRQLVDSCNVAQSDIYIGEPMTHVYKSMYDAIHAVYPGVIVLDKDGYTNLGRTKSQGWTNFAAIQYSDKGDDMPDALSDELMLEMYNADYMINVAALKAHARNGITLCAKLHFGSHGDHPGYGYGSFHLHAGLIATVDNDVMTSGVRGNYGMYRVLVDLMGHEKLGGNTVLFVVDGLWGGIEATDMAVKWKMAPFNNDWPNSLFMSQDEIALESVCLDFLRAEADKNTAFKDRPFFPGIDDYLHQGADKANWPAGLSYDPEGDGSEMPSSLGIHEHWNDPVKKQYTRDLYTNGTGIDLVSIPESLVAHENSSLGISAGMLANSLELKAYPNPCSTQAELSLQLKRAGTLEYNVYSLDGRLVSSFRKADMNQGAHRLVLNTEDWEKGVYMVRAKVISSGKIEQSSIKLLVQ